tara:strand:+ start:1137 stop:1397 length:261 start_codon:yes stop_codon:yes gene_type:complete
MLNKKSYMNESVILKESFFDKLMKFLKRKTKEHNDVKLKKMIKRSGILKNIDTINSEREKLDKAFEKQFGVKIKKKTYGLDDFVKI